MRKYGLDLFKAKAWLIHGEFYDYSRFEYVNNRTKGVILCPEHGEFQQAPSKHLNGCGCPKCWQKRLVQRLLKTLDDFLPKAFTIHENRYDYSRFEYKGSKVKGIIICKIHGEFLQTPEKHLIGCGCPKCSYIYRKELRRFTLDQFIDKAKLVHGDFYDYSKVGYKSTHSKVCLICPKHGEFNQTPANHCQGYGCPSCAWSDPKWQQEVEIFVQSIYSGIILYNDRTTIKHPITKYFRELDIYLPEIKIAFECQGTYFHDEKHFPGAFLRDQEKSSLCKETGVVLLPIWEHEWMDSDKRKLIENQIRGLIDSPQK